MKTYRVFMKMSFELCYDVQADCEGSALELANEKHEESFNDAGCYYWPADADDLAMIEIEEV